MKLSFIWFIVYSTRCTPISGPVHDLKEFTSVMLFYAPCHLTILIMHVILPYPEFTIGKLPAVTHDHFSKQRNKKNKNKLKKKIIFYFEKKNQRFHYFS